jgi:energy-coupling factor transporter ATP-binding protein EcfA2
MSIGIRLEKVTFQYANRAKPTLEDIDLYLAPGTITVVVGASGSGKSTLCYTLNGAIPQLIPGQLSGRVTVGNLDTQENAVSDLAQWVGLVLQDPESMFANLTVADEIAFGPANLGWPKAEILARVGEVASFVGLQGLEDKPVWNLSGGQVQRLGLASVLAMRPGVIVLDEPTSNLDPAARLNVYEIAQSLKAAGTAVIIVTKELDELLPRTDQLVVLHKGRVVFAGEPRSVLNQCGDEIRAMGIWLPEVVEVGLDLRAKSGQPGLPLPLTVGEAVELLAEHEVYAGEGITGPAGDPSATAPIIIQAADVTYHYPEAAGAVTAVNGVSLEIRHGELVAILGRNGAGKSTLAKLMMGLIKPAGGQLRVAEIDTARATPQTLAREIAFVFQNPEHQFVTDTVRDELVYSLLAIRVAEPELSQRVEAMLRLMDLEDVIGDHPFALSAGKKRRLGVATMLISQPHILVVDEPTYGQDRLMTESLMQTMLKFQRAGATVVMITHDMRLVETYIPRCVVMAAGRIIFDGPTAALFHRDDILEAASLRVTTLHELVSRLPARGKLRLEELIQPVAAPSELGFVGSA